MPENLYPQLLTAPPISQESLNIEMVRKYYQDIVNLKEKYTEKQRKYKNAYNRLLHASTGASSVAKEFHKLQTLYLQLMTHVRNVDRKMKVQTEENFQKTIMDELVNLKKALERK